MFSQATISLLSTETNKAHQYWALNDEALKFPFVNLPDKTSFHFGRENFLKEAWSKQGLGDFDPSLGRNAILKKIFSSLDFEEKKEQLSLFHSSIESDHIMNVSFDVDVNSLNEDEMVDVMMSITNCHIDSFWNGFKMSEYKSVPDVFAETIKIKDSLVSSESFDQVFKNVILSTGSPHMKNSEKTFIKFLKKNMFQFFSPYHLAAFEAACEENSINENALADSYKEMGKLFSSILQSLEEHFSKEHVFWVLKEVQTENPRKRSAKVVTPQIELFKKRAKIIGKEKLAKNYEKNGKTSGLDGAVRKLNIENEKSDENSAGERKKEETDKETELKNSSEKTTQDKSDAHSESEGKVSQENADANSKSEGDKDKIQDLEIGVADPYKKQREAMEKEASAGSGDNPPSTPEKSDTPSEPTKTKESNPSKKKDSTSKSVTNPYFKKKKSSSPKKGKDTPSDSKSKISGVRSRRSTADSLGSPQKRQQDSRHMELLFSLPVQDESYEKDGVTVIPWKFCVCIRGINSRVAGKQWFEMRPEVNVNCHELVYDFFKSSRPIEIGSFDKYTECIVEGISKICPVRKSPEEDIPSTVSSNNGQEYDVMQMSGICELLLPSDGDISQEMKNIAEEYKKMIQDRRYKDLFRMACWWTYCNPNKTTAEVIEIIDGEVYKDSFYQSWIGRHRGGVYPLLLNDRSRVFTSVLPNCRVESKFGCKLDEMLLNKDIRVVVNAMLDDIKTRKRQMIAAAVRERKLRKEENTTPHHILHLKNNRTLGHRMRKFFDSHCVNLDDSRGNIVDFCNKFRSKKRQFIWKSKIVTVLYFLVLLCCCYGIEQIFDNDSNDPFLSQSRLECNDRAVSLMKKIEIKEKNNEKKIEISTTVEDSFMNSNKLQQKEIYNMLLFEQKNKNFSFFKCLTCKGRYFWVGGLKNAMTKCNDCIEDNLGESDLLAAHALPVWEDKDGNIHEELPKCMEGITFGEMLCVQKVAFVFPTSHLKYGKYGLSGNTVMFMKDLVSVCNELPRAQVEICTLIREYMKNGELKCHKFMIRKSKVLEILRWLKEHHPSYKDIIINEKNLDWIGDNEVGTALQCVEIDKNAKSDDSEIETVARKQTEINGSVIESYGMALNEAIDKYNPDSEKIMKEIGIQKNTFCLDYPQIAEKPIDEYTYMNVFADAYPWLFPGGLGDQSSLVRESKSNALKWTRRLLHYHDGRFARDPSITFHLLNYIQRHVNNRDSLFFIKDNYCTKDKTVEDIRDEVANGNLSFVKSIQNYASYSIRGSDPWWRSRKHELDSWIGYHLKEKNGPPTLFMTFSCAEFWWKDLQEFLFERCQNTIDHDVAMKLKNGTKDEKQKAQAELVDKYSYCVQQFFQVRMDNWLETIGKNVLQIKHYYLRFEFAKGRGQIHAHMLAITKDYQFIAEYNEEYKKSKDGASEIYSEYARNRLKLSAEKPDYDPDALPSIPSTQKLYHECTNENEDLCSLIEQCHIHDCSNYCLRKNIVSGKRECRAGCGVETVYGSNITPGFELQDFDRIDIDYKRNIKLLKMKRNDPRMKQTSTTMLQSWRANCDLAVIVYDTDPVQLCPQDISRISGYIVSYCTKGNSSYKKEQEAICKVITKYDDDLAADDEKTSESHVLKLSRRILNSFSSSRIISKAEASLELMNLDLYWCTESFSHVRLSKASKLMGSSGGEFQSKSIDKIDKYIDRPKEMQELSLYEYIQKISESRRRKIRRQDDGQLLRLRKTQNTLKKEILHGVGLNGNPIYPVTEGYAKSVLLLHKPWSQKEPLQFDSNPTLLFSEFFEFLCSKQCPLEVILSYLVAKENSIRAEKTGGVEENEFVFTESDLQNSELMQYISCLHNLKMKSEFKECYKGHDGLYDFHERFSQFDPDNSAKNWLYEQKEIWQKSQNTPTKNFHKKFNTDEILSLDDVSNNFEQETVVYAIVRKLKEWIEFPEHYAKNPSLRFEPLLLTVCGEGGTGKSHVIRVITNVVEKIFDVKVSITCAPTGNAAYNVKGKTCHSFFSIEIEKGTVGSMSLSKQQKLKDALKRLLMVIIDERSLLSCEDLAKIHHNCVRFAHGGNNNHLPWGGIPLVILLGDDKQLPAVKKGKSGGGATTIFKTDGSNNYDASDSKLHREGITLFKKLGKRVVSLKKNQRVEQGNEDLQRYLQSLRNGPGLSKKDARTLLSYRFENPFITKQRRDMFIEKAIWIFTTNREVDNHNNNLLKKLVNTRNPLISCSYFMQSKDAKRKLAYKSHFKREDVYAAPVNLCRGARVSIDRNLWQEVGLFNGALGTIIDIRYDKNKSPIKGDLPAYIIVNMDEYVGPIWDPDNPTHVPIPVGLRDCKKGCCSLKSIPLNVSFARTLHKFQGQSVGPKYSNKYMVFGPGTSFFEAQNPGLLYVGLSRMSTLGESVENSPFLFFGPDANENRFTNVTHKRGEKSQPTRIKYKSVVMREKWIQFLSRNERNFPVIVTSDEKMMLKNWLENLSISVNDLDEIICFHSKKNKSS